MAIKTDVNNAEAWIRAIYGPSDTREGGRYVAKDVYADPVREEKPRDGDLVSSLTQDQLRLLERSVGWIDAPDDNHTRDVEDAFALGLPIPVGHN